MIKDKLEEALNQCIEAAGHEYEPTVQKTLLKVKIFIRWKLICITLLVSFLSFEKKIIVKAQELKRRVEKSWFFGPHWMVNRGTNKF